MKSLLLTFLTLTAFFTSLIGQWEVINAGDKGYSIIDFVNKDVGWMSNSLAFQKTMDGGETWVSGPWNSEYGRIYDFDFINDSVGWVSTDQSYDDSWLFKTIDGGKSWEKMLESDRLRILYASEDIVIVSTGSSTMLKSADGGTTWVEITPAGYAEYAEHSNSISFIGSDTGIYISSQSSSSGTAINRTFDGGETWQERPLPEFENLIEIGFIDNQTGYFVAQNKASWTGDNHHVICKTEDAFNTWTVVTKNQYPIRSCHFINQEVCIAILEDSIERKIVKSYNGGKSWIASESPGFFGSMSSSMSFCNDSAGSIYCSKCWFCGEATAILKSIDQGNTWSMLNLSYPFNDLCFINSQTGFAVGGEIGEADSWGDILVTNDGGKSWNFILSGTSPIMNCDFVNDSVGFAECSALVQQGIYSTNLYQTLNGGKSWSVYPHDFSPGTRFKFINEQVGFAGNSSGIYLSNNCGESWDKLLTAEEASLIDGGYGTINSIVASDANTFWAITGDDCVIKFSIEGVGEKVDLGLDLAWHKIFFTDENSGWIAGGERVEGNPFEQILFKTEDGGESWFLVEIPYQIYDICFKDMKKGWAVGRDSQGGGVILETTNGGDDWTTQVNSIAPIVAIDYNDGYVWALGRNGLILKNYDSTYVSTMEHPDQINDGKTLLRIYPNPTNSILNIETGIQGHYSIELLNLNGQVLLKRVYTGTYHQFDLSSLREGIYFITVRSKDYVTTKQIIKL